MIVKDAGADGVSVLETGALKGSSPTLGGSGCHFRVLERVSITKNFFFPPDVDP